jgi:hypothetical protein
MCIRLTNIALEDIPTAEKRGLASSLKYSMLEYVHSVSPIISRIHEQQCKRFLSPCFLNAALPIYQITLRHIPECNTLPTAVIYTRNKL